MGTPHATLAIASQVLLVRGNADRDLVTMARGGEPPKATPSLDIWAPATHAAACRGAGIAATPARGRIGWSGRGAFCHGTPRD